jgi:hypothetical protein
MSEYIIFSQDKKRSFIMIEKNMDYEIKVNGITYIPKDEIDISEMEYVIVRTYSAGVFAGSLEHRNGKEVVIRNSRRLWYWEGAASLSQLAMEGTSNPSKCKFACVVNKTILTEVIEIISITSKAKKSIESIGEWKC